MSNRHLTVFLFLGLLNPNLSLLAQIDIPNGSIVEGSVEFGGMQPHYVIDFDAPEFSGLRSYAKDLRNEPDMKKKIELLKAYINEKVILHKSYSEPAYVQITNKYKAEKTNIPLSKYLEGHAGVCREHALIYHMSLKEAGVPNEYLYAQVFVGNRTEDHAMNLIRINGELRTFDAYNPYFHDKSLSELKSGSLVVKNSQTGIVKIHDFPKVHPPKASTKNCPTVLINALKVLDSSVKFSN